MVVEEEEEQEAMAMVVKAAAAEETPSNIRKRKFDGGGKMQARAYKKRERKCLQRILGTWTLRRCNKPRQPAACPRLCPRQLHTLSNLRERVRFVCSSCIWILESRAH